METLRYGPPRWLGVLYLALAGVQALGFLVGAVTWLRALLIVGWLGAGFLALRGGASVFTAEGVRLRRWGLGWQEIPSAVVAGVREGERGRDGARLILGSGQTVAVPYVPRPAIPQLQRLLSRTGTPGHGPQGQRG